jgi:phage terminase small subunit
MGNYSPQLTDKQRRFVDEYLVDLNASQAAIRAGYAPGSASVTGCRLLANAKIAEVLTQRRVDATRRLELTADRVLEEIGRLAFANVADFYVRDENGNLQLDESAILDPVKAAAISQVETQTKADGTQTVKLKLADKRAALSDLARHLGINGEALEPVPEVTPPMDLRHMAMAMLNLILEGKRAVELQPKQIEAEALGAPMIAGGLRLRRRD